MIYPMTEETNAIHNIYDEASLNAIDFKIEFGKADRIINAILCWFNSKELCNEFCNKPSVYTILKDKTLVTKFQMIDGGRYIATFQRHVFF